MYTYIHTLSFLPSQRSTKMGDTQRLVKHWTAARRNIWSGANLMNQFPAVIYKQIQKRVKYILI
jgi:hypothetical protein